MTQNKKTQITSHLIQKEFSRNFSHSTQKGIPQKNPNLKISKIYIRVDSILDEKIADAIKKMEENPGTSSVFFFDLGQNKYIKLKNTGLNLSEDVILSLKNIFGDKNVVVK